MKDLYRDLVNALGRYTITVVGGTGVFMLLAPLAGYLPYSDRPGPGWHGGPFEVQWREFVGYAGFVLVWLLFFAAYGFVVAFVTLALVRTLERFGAPIALVRAAGGLISAALTFFLLGQVGWYISLGLVVGVVGALLSTYFGAFQLPRGRVSASPAA